MCTISRTRLRRCRCGPDRYQWQVSLWDGRDMLDMWDCLPDMTIATDVHQHHMDEWNGILNLPTQFCQLTGEEAALGPRSRF